MEHHEITSKTIEYNKVICGFLYFLIFMATPLAGVSLFIAIFVKFNMPFITEACVMIMIQTLAMVLFIVVKSAAVYVEGKQSYCRLSSILVKQGHRLNYETKIMASGD
ncbi:hypothetical protein HDE_13120 [Halotydeus destructor]|nr:hypothetical protein HDE_13120 [Halotydeus destructor]